MGTNLLMDQKKMSSINIINACEVVQLTFYNRNLFFKKHIE